MACFDPPCDGPFAASGLEEDLANWLDGGGVLLSLNRFERKKGHGLALHALRETLDRHAMSSGACASARLVVAGGLDARLPENVAVLRELRQLACDLNLEDRVVFLSNISERERCARTMAFRCASAANPLRREAPFPAAA